MRRIGVSIKAEFGSDFQSKMGIEMLGGMLSGLKRVFKENHRKNNLDYRVEGLTPKEQDLWDDDDMSTEVSQDCDQITRNGFKRTQIMLMRDNVDNFYDKLVEELDARPGEVPSMSIIRTENGYTCQVEWVKDDR